MAGEDRCIYDPQVLHALDFQVIVDDFSQRASPY